MSADVIKTAGVHWRVSIVFNLTELFATFSNYDCEYTSLGEIRSCQKITVRKHMSSASQNLITHAIKLNAVGPKIAAPHPTFTFFYTTFKWFHIIGLIGISYLRMDNLIYSLGAKRI